MTITCNTFLNHKNDLSRDYAFHVYESARAHSGPSDIKIIRWLA